MNAPEKFFLPDVQSSADHRALAIQQVGVRGLRYPIAVRDLVSLTVTATSVDGEGVWTAQLQR